jgi:putative ABC transport system permease protein
MPERLDSLLKDVRYAARALRRAPRFATAALLTLALGLGSMTVIFSLVDHIVLRPLPYRHVEQLVVVREVIDGMGSAYPSLGANASHFLGWQRGCGACEDVAALRKLPLTLTEGGDPQSLNGARVSANFLPLLGVQPALGRAFAPDEDAPGRDRVVLLSDGFWRRQYGSDRSIVGRTISLNDVSYVVAGVLPPEFALPAGDALGLFVGLPREIDVFKPLALTPRESSTPGEFDYVAIARLRPGATAAVARAQLDAVVASIIAGRQLRMTVRTSITPLQEQVVGAVGRPLLLLLAAVAAVLLIVCVNLANLTLARNVGRRREAAVRVALGAGRARLTRLALAESLLLALSGGTLGFLVALWGIKALVATAPSTLPRIGEVALDGRVFGVAAIVAIIVGLAVGAIPALRYASADPAEALKSGGRTATGSRDATRRRSAFIAAQIALSTILLVGTGLFLRSFIQVLGVDRGFQTDRILALDVALPRAKYSSIELRGAFHQRAISELAALPDVQSVGMTTAIPLEGEAQTDLLSLENDPRPEAERPVGGIRYVSPTYFETIGTPIRRGRAFDERDRGQRVVVLSERAAQALWPGEDALGKRMVPGSNDPLAEVIGIVSDVHTSTLEKQGSLTAYIPYWQAAPVAASLLIRTGGDPGAITSAARAVLRRIDSSVPVAKSRTMEQIVSAAVAQRRFQVVLLAMFALMALVTASIGIYGVISQSLTSRAGEIGVRMALGARPSDVHRLVLGEGLRPVALGLGIGIAGSMALGRWVESLLFEVRPVDPLTLAVVVVILGAVAVIACAMPARRATMTGLAGMLRSE